MRGAMHTQKTSSCRAFHLDTSASAPQRWRYRPCCRGDIRWRAIPGVVDTILSTWWASPKPFSPFLSHRSRDRESARNPCDMHPHQWNGIGLACNVAGVLQTMLAMGCLGKVSGPWSRSWFRNLSLGWRRQAIGMFWSPHRALQVSRIPLCLFGGISQGFLENSPVAGSVGQKRRKRLWRGPPCT